mgnify:FL=1
MAEYVNGKNIEEPKNKFSYKQPDYDPNYGFMGLKKLFSGLNKPGQEGFDPTKGLFGLTLRPEQIERRARWRKNRGIEDVPVPKDTDEDLDDELHDEDTLLDWIRSWGGYFGFGGEEGGEGTVDIDTSVGNADLGLLTNELKDAGVQAGDYTKTFLYDDIGDDSNWWDITAPYEGSIKEDIHRNPKDYVGSPFITSRRGKVF